MFAFFANLLRLSRASAAAAAAAAPADYRSAGTRLSRPSLRKARRALSISGCLD